MRHAEQDALAGGFDNWCGPRDKQLVSRNLDEVAALLQREVGPQKYEAQVRTRPFFTKIQFRQLRDLTLSYAWFTSAMEISSTPIEPYYSLFFRRSGFSEYRAGRRVFVTSPSCGALLPGMRPIRVRTNENWHVFGTRFPPDAIRRELSQLLGRPIIRPVEFDPMVNFDYGAGRIVKRTLVRLYSEAAQNNLDGISSPGMQHLERALITIVLEGLSHNYSKFLNGPETNIAPWQVRAVEEFILENANQPLSLGELAAVGGVSARSLQYTFRRHRGCSPMEFLRNIRFERVRNDLRHAVHDTTVTSTAMRWGFLHLGRFAAEYRAKFSESPSATLRRSLRRQWSFERQE
jgi:AraC-like DNA-binding protein